MSISSIDRFRREFPDVAVALDTQGWRIEYSGKGHIKFRTPTGQVVIGSSTPSGIHGWSRLTADLAKAGLDATPVLRVYVAPPERALSSESVTAMTPVAPEAAPLDESEFWRSEEAATYLEATYGEVREWRDAGYLPESKNERGHPRGRYFKRVDVLAFSDSETYRELRVVHKTRPRRAKSESVDSIEARSTVGVWKDSTLVAAIAEALRPIIQDEALKALRDFYKER